MDSIITAGILLNAAKIPLSIFRRLCENYQPEELFTGESFWDELGMTPQHKQRLSALLDKASWAERELDRTETLGARFITAKDIDYPARLLDLKSPPVGLYVIGNPDDIQHSYGTMAEINFALAAGLPVFSEYYQGHRTNNMLQLVGGPTLADAAQQNGNQ